jgi:hypothetical protein
MTNGPDLDFPIRGNSGLRNCAIAAVGITAFLLFVVASMAPAVADMLTGKGRIFFYALLLCGTVGMLAAVITLAWAPGKCAFNRFEIFRDRAVVSNIRALGLLPDRGARTIPLSEFKGVAILPGDMWTSWGSLGPSSRNYSGTYRTFVCLVHPDRRYTIFVKRFISSITESRQGLQDYAQRLSAALGLPLLP